MRSGPKRRRRRWRKRSGTAATCCSILGYFTCGFQLFFITVHLPAYLVDRGLPASIGGWTIAVIGLFNIVGSIGSGYHRQPDAQALPVVGDLFQPLAGDPGVHPAAAEPGGDADLRRRHGPALAVDHPADLGAGGDHVRQRAG